MKVAILQCDNVLEKFQHRFGNYPKMVERMFSEIDIPLSFDNYDCQQGKLPTNIDEYDFFITTGSKASVYDDLEWVQQLVSFIQLLDKHQKKLIGICFGHQLIAMARNQTVEKSIKGWGIGIAANRISSHPAWMHDKATGINILVSHQDQISELPDDALVVAESDFCPFFIVQWGEHFLSIQGHPEWSTEYSRTLINDRKHLIEADTIEAGLNSLTITPDNAKFVRWIISFVQH